MLINKKPLTCLRAKISAVAAIIVGIFISSAVHAEATDLERSSRLFLFEQEKVPSEIVADKGSKISISNQRYKDGRHSLQWRYSSGVSLVINADIGFQPYVETGKNKSRHSFMLWMYNEIPTEDKLVFQFGTGAEVNAEFSARLNFRGWRALVVPFESDMIGLPVAEMNRLTIVAPKSVDQGVLHFDQMALSIPVDPRWPTPDYQLPLLNKGINSSPNAHWSALLQYDGWRQDFSAKPHATASKGELAAIRLIEQRVDDDLLVDAVGSLKKAVKSLRKTYRSFLFDDDQVGQRLRPVIMRRELDTFRQAKMADGDLAILNKSSIHFEPVGKFMLKLARTYRISNDKKVKKNLRRMFAELVVHLADQGIDRGSARGVMHHQGYTMRDWAKSLYLMRNALGDSRVLLQNQLAWYMGLGRVFRPEEQIIGFNVDVMNTLLQGMLFSALMESDPTLRVAYLRQMSHWMSFSMDALKGLAGGIQSDGSFYHHSQHYVAYGNGGLRGLAPVVYYFSRTPFRLSATGHHKLRHSVLMSRIFSNDLKIPMSLSGRHPDGEQTIALVPFKYLVMAGLPDTAHGFDQEMAGAYQRLTKNMAKDAFSKMLSQEGVEAEDDPSGSWVMNYSGLALHRRNDWLASARGYSRYLVGNESYVKANHYGRYLNYGHLEILPADSSQRGFKEEGWDWNRWPGTTTVHLPLEKLAANLGQVDRAGIEEMLLSDEAFSGGNQLNGNSAMFAMKLHGHPKYDDSFRARKSVFFFDDLIVATGSGIQNANHQYPTETTLFQDFLSGSTEPTVVDGEVFSGLSVNESIATDNGFYLLDRQRNAYYLPVGQSVIVQRKNQRSVVNEGKIATSGDFSTAYIDHGRAPRNQGYEYAILVGAGRKGGVSFVDAMSNPATARYKVMQRDNRAHIVRHESSNTFGYALFESSSSIKHGLLQSVDTPAMLLIKQHGDLLEIAHTDPDLNLYQGIDPSQYDERGVMQEVSVYSRSWRYSKPKKKTTRLVLKGHWKSTDSDSHRVVSVKDGVTVVDVDSVASVPVQMKFERTL